MSVFVIDRIEGDRAVVEIIGELIDLPLEAFPKGIKEGDAISFSMESVDSKYQEAKARLKRLEARNKQANIGQLKTNDAGEFEL